MRVGVLALQGGFAAHAAALAACGHAPVEVRTSADLATVGGLVLPGGESTTMLKLLDWTGLAEPLDAFVRAGRPILATCAGLILAARQVTNPPQRGFGWLDVAVARNAWGRQLDSFEARSDRRHGVTPYDAVPDALPLVFIRAPRITETGPEVEVLATFEGEPVLVRQGAFVGGTFHPELTEDRAVHRAVFG